MNDSTRRAVRTAFDVVLAVLAAVLLAVPAFELEAADAAKIAAIVGGLTLFFTKVRNALEDSGLIPAVLKAPASDGANPVPDDGAHG